MLTPPPRSRLFPYTTLFRSRIWQIKGHNKWNIFGCNDNRSEEHTSELQSRFDLVCRLLLEKKNKTAAARPSVHKAAPTPTASVLSRNSRKTPLANASLPKPV